MQGLELNTLDPPMHGQGLSNNYVNPFRLSGQRSMSLELIGLPSEEMVRDDQFGLS